MKTVFKSTSLNDIVVIAAYPPNEQWLNSIRADGVSVDVRLLKDLRHPSMFLTIKKIRAEKIGRLIIYAFSLEVRPLIPIMKIFAHLLAAKRVQLVTHDGPPQLVTRLDAIKSGFLTVGSLLDGYWRWWQSQKQLKKIQELPRMTFAEPVHQPSSVLYIKANPMGQGPVGGAAAHTAGVINGLSKAGCKVTYLSMEPPVETNGDIQFHEVTPLKTAVPPLNSISKAGEFNLLRAHHHFVQSGVELPVTDFIYQRLSLDNYSGVVLSRKMKKPLVVEYNGSEVWVAKNWGNGLAMTETAKNAEQVMLDHATLIVTVSEVLKQQLISLGVDAHRIVMIPNGVDASRYHPSRYSKNEIELIRKQVKAKKSSVVFTFVGTFGPWHGAEIFAKAISQLIQNHKKILTEHNAQFVFVGEGLCKPDAESALSAGNDEFVTFTGIVAQSETPKYLQMSDVVISPHVPNHDGTPFFGSPTKLFEYMASGKPIIASDLEQIGDILKASPKIHDLKSLPVNEKPPQQACAFLCRPGHVDELGKAILFLLERPEWRKQLGRQSRDLALEKYTWDHHVRIMLDALKHVDFKSQGKI